MNDKPEFYIIEPLNGTRSTAIDRAELISVADDFHTSACPGVAILCSLSIPKTEIIESLKQAIEYAEKDLVDLR